MVIDRGAPVLAHAWFGSMRQDGDQALIGWIDLDPAVRPPRNDGSRDVEILHDLTLHLLPAAAKTARYAPDAADERVQSTSSRARRQAG
jgi:hypothetical protein